MTDDDPYKVRVLAQDPDCPTDGTCFVLGEVPARPGRVQGDARIVEDPRLLAAYAHKVGPGEILVEFDKSEPLHPYERYECEWGYVLTSGAGEDIRVLHIGEHQIPAELVDHDYWLLDDTHPVRMHYAATGAFLGATVEPDLIDLYRSGRRAVWGTEVQPVAEEFAIWWSRHPELHRDARWKVA